MEKHAKEFSSWGLNNADDVAKCIMDAVSSQKGIATGGGEVIYDVFIRGKTRQLSVVGNNGFIVTAHPFTK